jgi:hypothetical protein
MCAATSHTIPPLTRKDIKSLVRKLGADARPSQQKTALSTILALQSQANVPHHTLSGAIPPPAMDTLAAIAAAGAIPKLAQLLGPGSSADLQANAAGALSNLGRHAGNADAVKASGIIPRLVQLLGRGSHKVQEEAAAGTLCNLSQENAATIAAAGAIPALVKLGLLGEADPQGQLGASGPDATKAFAAPLMMLAGKRQEPCHHRRRGIQRRCAGVHKAGPITDHGQQQLA